MLVSLDNKTFLKRGLLLKKRICLRVVIFFPLTLCTQKGQNYIQNCTVYNFGLSECDGVKSWSY